MKNKMTVDFRKIDLLIISLSVLSIHIALLSCIVSFNVNTFMLLNATFALHVFFSGDLTKNRNTLSIQRRIPGDNLVLLEDIKGHLPVREKDASRLIAINTSF